MPKFDRQAQTALRLIKKNGGTLEVMRQQAAAFDPVTRRTTAAATLVRNFACVALPPGRSQSLVPSTLREKLEIEFHIAQAGNQDFVPMEADSALWAGQRYRLLWSTTYDPAGDGAIYTLAYGAK